MTFDQSTALSASVNANVISVGTDPTSESNSRIVVALSLAGGVTQDVTIRTVVVTAHTEEAGSVSTPVTFIGSSDATGIVVPYNANTTIKVNLALSFAFNRASTVTVAGSIANYLLADEVNRFVTTHALAGATQGDDQVIYGEKRMRHKLMLDGNEGGALEFWYDADPCVSVTQSNEFGLVFDVTHADFDPDVDGELYEFKADGRELCTLGVKDGSGSMTGLEYASMRHISCGSIEAIDASKVYMDSPFVPGDGSATLGDAANHWSTCYANTLETIRIKSSAASGKIALASSLEPLSNDVTIGTSLRRVHAVNADSYYEGTVQGYLSKPFTTTQLPSGLVGANIGIGCITPFVAAQGVIGGNKAAGDTFTLAVGAAVIPEIFLSGNALVVETGTRVLPAGTYQALVNIRDTSPHAFGLVMRIA
ncbi:unnamed protein product [Cylicocyclus nassatus]|uniref:Uncharacterized protein n=1 Tax=Cylicocyclus nassatus TaxID=53992 RepID=A0AA36M6L9_CYLNA|nr:unnamed protein product [Cylicocyclus nassatus]